MLVVLGCDPGGRWSGVVQRSGAQLLDFDVLEALGPARSIATVEYGLVVAAWLIERRDRALALGHEVLVAVEGLKAPGAFHRGERSLVDPAGLMGVAVVYATVRVAVPEAVVVAPGGNGAGPLSQYPKPLVGVRERKGAGILSHARSAWDVAGEARRAQRYPQLS